MAIDINAHIFQQMQDTIATKEAEIDRLRDTRKVIAQMDAVGRLGVAIKRIERLRAALQRIVDSYGTDHDSEFCRNVAENTLSQASAAPTNK